MAEGTADDRDDDDPAPPRTGTEADIGAAVDDALEPELKRRRARFLQEIMGADRIEGVGRSDAEREDRLRRDIDEDRPDE